MKITLLATGSRGDVQPFLALGVGLLAAGHEVDFATNFHYAEWAQSYGVNVLPIQWDIRSVFSTPEAQAMINKGNFIADFRYLNKVALSTYSLAQNESWQVLQGAENLVYSALSPWGYHIAEKLKIPSICGMLHLMTPTRYFPCQFVEVDLGGEWNRMTHFLAVQFVWLFVARPSNTFRRKLGLRPIYLPDNPFLRLSRSKATMLYNLSPTVIPRPMDWSPNIHMHGYWFLPAAANWQPPRELVSFIENGAPPIYIGFGSMTNLQAEEMTKLVIKALEICGQRAVFVGGWGGLSPKDLPESLFFASDVPHDWLFPRMAAVVHHGGMGTTAANLRAGIPGVVVAHMQDQPYWGEKIHKLGVAPKHLMRKNLTPEKLAERITIAVNDAGMRQRAAEVAANIFAEDGVGETVRIIENTFSKT
jgi:sterol 3beta-glucosyltransferase